MALHYQNCRNNATSANLQKLTETTKMWTNGICKNALVCQFDVATSAPLIFIYYENVYFDQCMHGYIHEKLWFVNKAIWLCKRGMKKKVCVCSTSSHMYSQALDIMTLPTIYKRYVFI